MNIQDGIIVDGMLYEAVNRQMQPGEAAPCKQCSLGDGCGVLCTTLLLDCDYFRLIGRVNDISVQPTNTTRHEEDKTEADSGR